MRSSPLPFHRPGISPRSLLLVVGTRFLGSCVLRLLDGPVVVVLDGIFDARILRRVRREHVIRQRPDGAQFEGLDFDGVRGVFVAFEFPPHRLPKCRSLRVRALMSRRDVPHQAKAIAVQLK